MDLTFKLIDLIIIVGICQGVFLSLTLQRISNNNFSANRILSYLILLATIMLIGRFVYFKYLTKWVFLWSFVVDALVFLFGPVIYTYIKRLLFKGNQNYRLPFVSFIPFFGMLLFALSFMILYNSEEYYELYIKDNLTFIFTIISIIMISFNLFFILKSFLLVQQFKNMEKDVFSFDQTPIKYLNLFLLSLSICVLAWLAAWLNTTFYDRYFSYVNYDSIWVAIPVFIYVIGYFSLKQPELFRIPIQKQNSTDKKDRLSPFEIELLKQKLDSLMINEKIFLESNLTLADVASTLETSPNNLSWLLNQVYKTTFYDFINRYRVKEFVRKIEGQEYLKHTILALSMDVGFNSKSTFNKAFKEAMNETPSNFIKKHRAA